MQDVWKFTLPSCSVAAPVTWDRATDAGRNKATTSVTMSGMRFMAGLLTQASLPASEAATSGILDTPIQDLDAPPR